MKKLITIIFLAILPILASAYSVKINGIYYNLDNDNKTAQVTWGDWDYINYSEGDGRYSGNISIPENIDVEGITYPITSIGISAFKDCKNLLSVTISEGIEVLHNGAFYNCENLSSISLPNTLKYIESTVFYQCYKLESITLPSNLRGIGPTPFAYTGIKSIIIPKSVTNIDYTPFAYCSKLRSLIVEEGNPFFDSRNDCNGIVEKSSNKLIQGIATTVIPADISTIGDGAFMGQSELEEFVIPDNITTIGRWAFSDCEGLVSITLSNSMTEVTENAFSNCKSLKQVILPSGLECINYGAFGNCTSLESINLPNGLQTLNGGFEGAGLKSITIPASVKSMLALGCSNSLESIIVEDGNLYYDSRDNCNAIIETGSNTLIFGCKNTVIPSSVTSIGGAAFSGCSDLTTITIPNSVTRIGDDAFMSCKGLTSIVFPESLTAIGIRSFCETGLESIYIPKNLTSIDTWAFAYCDINSVVVDEENPKFDSRDNCNAIIETGSNSIIAGFNKSTFPMSVFEIGYGAFTGSYNRDTLKIPDHIQTIGYYAFSESNFATLVLGKNISNIRTYSFQYCSNLKNVLCYAEKVPTTSKAAFDECPKIKEGTLYVDSSLIDDYKSQSPWNEFAQILPLSASAIRSVTYKNGEESIYSIRGNKLGSLQKGLNIVKDKDGRIVKKIVK